MSGLPPIVPIAPIVIPAVTVPEIQYNQMYMASLVIQNHDVNTDAEAHVELVPYRTLEDESFEANPQSVTFKVENLNALAQTDTDLATIIYLIQNYVIKIGRERGLVAPAEEE